MRSRKMRQTLYNSYLPNGNIAIWVKSEYNMNIHKIHFKKIKGLNYIGEKTDSHNWIDEEDWDWDWKACWFLDYLPSTWDAKDWLDRNKLCIGQYFLMECEIPRGYSYGYEQIEYDVDYSFSIKESIPMNKKSIDRINRAYAMGGRLKEARDSVSQETFKLNVLKDCYKNPMKFRLRRFQYDEYWGGHGLKTRSELIYSETWNALVYGKSCNSIEEADESLKEAILEKYPELQFEKINKSNPWR